MFEKQYDQKYNLENDNLCMPFVQENRNIFPMGMACTLFHVGNVEFHMEQSLPLE
jgi:hypothetical protein